MLVETSTAQSTRPISECLIAAERILGPNLHWRTTNPSQIDFLRNYFLVHRAAPILGIIESLASFSAKEIEAWLKQRGFNEPIGPFEKNEFGTASVLDVLLNFPEGSAERSVINLSDGPRPAVIIRGGVKFWQFVDSKDVIVELPTTDPKARVFIMMTLNTRLRRADALLTTARYYSKAQKIHLKFPPYDGVIFPMIHFEKRTDLDWLRGMWTASKDGIPAIIRSAIQINRLRMNEIGVRAQSAVHIEVPCAGGGHRSPFVFNRPFLLWIDVEHHEKFEQVFAAWLDYDSWKDPKSLE